MVKTSDDVQLIIDARSGCHYALNRLATEVHRNIYPVLYRMTHDPHLAYDLLQETLIIMLKSLKHLERIEGFWGWIHTIARSRVYDHFRKKQSREPAGFADLDMLTADNNYTVLQNVLNKERDEVLAAAVGNLRKQYRDVVYLRHFENRSYSEVASMSQCTPQQARIRFFRAKRSLREALCRSGYENDY